MKKILIMRQAISCAQTGLIVLFAACHSNKISLPEMETGSDSSVVNTTQQSLSSDAVSSDTSVSFSEKIKSKKTPLTFTFSYYHHLYKFYAYANYFLPSKNCKTQDRHQLNILASMYDGLQTYDDVVDGGSLIMDERLQLNKTLKVDGALYVNGVGRFLKIEKGSIVLTRGDSNFISGNFEIEGDVMTSMSDSAVAKFHITDGTFERLPVNVHRISDFNGDWLEGNH